MMRPEKENTTYRASPKYMAKSASSISRIFQEKYIVKRLFIASTYKKMVNDIL